MTGPTTPEEARLFTETEQNIIADFHKSLPLVVDGFDPAIQYAPGWALPDKLDDPSDRGNAPEEGCTVDQVLRAVARAFCFVPRDIVGHGQTNELRAARVASYSLARFHCPQFSTPEIARMMRRKDHTTVSYGVKRAATLLSRDADFKEKYMAAHRLLEIRTW